MNILRIIFIIAMVLITNACTSMPIRTAPEISEQYNDIQLGTVALTECIEIEESKLEYQIDCDYALDNFAQILKETKLFRKVTVGKDKNAEYYIKLKLHYQEPYQSSIGHNPGLLVLSIIIPFWEDVKYGHEFIILSRHTNEENHINNVDEGTFLMWSGSMIINLSPDRGLPGSHYQSEINYLRNSIINALDKSTLHKAIKRTAKRGPLI